MGQHPSIAARFKDDPKVYLNRTAGKSYYGKGKRKDIDNSGEVASFIDAEDEIPLLLMYSLQKKRPVKEFKNYKLTKIILADEAMVWIETNGASAIVALVGQNFFFNPQHLLDDLNIAGSAARGACELRLKTVAEGAINEVKKYGITNIICVGYSLGGATAACVSDQVTRSIVFNGGAPVTNVPRLTPDNCKCYHIVGDAFSTHWTKAKRIYLDETNLRASDIHNINRAPGEVFQVDQVNWVDIPYYHEMDRFMDFGGPYKIVDATFEQNSLSNYLFQNKDELHQYSNIAGAASSSFNVLSKLREAVCRNPIPGASKGESCDQDEDPANKIVGGLLGGAIGGAAGALAGGVGAAPGAIAGATLGSKILQGEKGLLDEFAPDIIAKIDQAGVFASQYAKERQDVNTKKGTFSGTVVDNQPVIRDRDPNRDGFVQRKAFNPLKAME